MASVEETFATCMRTCRAMIGLTQSELAERVGVDKQSVINWEKGEYMPSLRTAVKLADEFGISLNQLVGK